MHCLGHIRLKSLFLIFILSLLDSVTLTKVNTVNNFNDSSAATITCSEDNHAKERSHQLEARKNEEKDMMGKILPMMIIPFMVSTAMIPMMLVSLKFMLLKSAFIGKLAVILLILNMFRRRSEGQGGVFNHNIDVKEMSMAHYGYSGDEEYGAYINK